MATFSDGSNPVFDAGRMKPMRVRTFRTVENGKPITRTERRPQGKYLMVIDSAGNEVPLKLHNAISEQAQFDPYKLHQQSIKTQPNHEWGTAPMIPSTACPQQTEFQHKMPEDLQTGTKCSASADGAHPVGEDQRTGEIHWCKCIVSLALRRREKNAEIEAARDPRTTIMEATLNNSQEMNKHLAELLKNMSNTGAAPTGGGKPK